MAQPSGQVLVDTDHPWAGPLWYAHDTGGGGANDAGLWNALAGIMEAKTGTGAVSTEGGAKVINTAATTYFTLASTVNVNNGQTLFFRVRATANNNASMPCGDRTATNNFVWLNNGGKLQVRRTSAGAVETNHTVINTMTTYHITFGADNLMRLHLNGGAGVVMSGTSSANLVIKHLLAGYSGGSFSLNGALECIGVIPAALTNAEVAAHAADLYQTLEAPTGGTSHELEADALAQAFATATLAESASITLTSPVPYQSRQRNLASSLAALPFTVSGTYTGTPASIQYRFAGGTWGTLIASPAGGAFSTTLALPTGQGTFEVRFSDDIGITDSAAFVTVGDGFASAGQSNACGRAAGVVAPVASAFTATKLGRDGVWKALSEANTQAGSFDEAASAGGSYYGALSNSLQTQGVPVFFIPCALGGVGINEYDRFAADPSNPVTLYGDVWQAHIASGGLRAIIFFQGETDAANGLSQSSYAADLNTLVNNWWSDIATPTFIVKICRWNPSIYTNIDAIRAAQQDVIDTNPHAAGGADANVWTSGNVHYSTTTEVNAVASAIYAGMASAFYASDLQANAAAQTAATAALSVLSSSTLSANAQAQATASAELLKGVSLSAAGLAVASAGAAASHTVPLQASAAAIALAGAQMALAVTLGAAGLAVASGTAALTVGSASGLSADGQAQASATAVLSLAVRLSGAAVSQALASASLAAGKTLAASGVAQAAGTASLQVGSGTELTAAGTAQASAGATLQLMVPISAASLAQAQASGSLLLTVPLSAAAFAQASSSAEFAGDVQMSAQGLAMASATAALVVTSDYAKAPQGTRFYQSSTSSRPARMQAGGRPSR